MNNGNCAQVAHRMWSLSGRNKGFVCTGLSKGISGSFEDRCHWWFELDGIAYSELYNTAKGEHVLVRLNADRVDRMMDCVRKYTADEYQWYIDIEQDMIIARLRQEGQPVSHLCRVLMLQYIRAHRPPTSPQQFLQYIRKIAQFRTQS